MAGLWTYVLGGVLMFIGFYGACVPEEELTLTPTLISTLTLTLM